jgi:hypothetical protein
MNEALLAIALGAVVGALVRLPLRTGVRLEVLASAAAGSVGAAIVYSAASALGVRTGATVWLGALGAAATVAVLRLLGAFEQQRPTA